MNDNDEAYIGRGIGIFLSGGIWVASALNFIKVMHAPGGIGLLQIVVTAGFFLGMICYTQLCIAEGRARERRERAERERVDRERRRPEQ